MAFLLCLLTVSDLVVAITISKLLEQIVHWRDNMTEEQVPKITEETVDSSKVSGKTL